MPNKAKLIEQVDAILPQTQCGECDYNGCQPYAEAMVFNNEAINKCPPGGVETLGKLAEILHRDTDILEKTRAPSTVVIREEECIGCTKCIQACPVDAIVGTGKLMHTVISDECTGCELCVEPCPVDCIDIIQLSESQFDPNTARQRFEFRNERIAQEEKTKQEKEKPSASSIKEYLARMSKEQK